MKRAADRAPVSVTNPSPISLAFTPRTSSRSVTSQVRLQKLAKNSMLYLLFPDEVTNAAEARKKGGAAGAGSKEEGKGAAEDGSEAKRAKTDEAPLPTVPMDAMLGKYIADETLSYTNPTVGQPAPTAKNVRFRSFPKYMMVRFQRAFQTADWRQVKVEKTGAIPETDHRFMSRRTSAWASGNA